MASSSLQKWLLLLETGYCADKAIWSYEGFEPLTLLPHLLSAGVVGAHCCPCCGSCCSRLWLWWFVGTTQTLLSEPQRVSLWFISLHSRRLSSFHMLVCFLCAQDLNRWYFTETNIEPQKHFLSIFWLVPKQGRYPFTSLLTPDSLCYFVEEFHKSKWKCAWNGWTGSAAM